MIHDLLLWDSAAAGTEAMHRLLAELSDSVVHSLIDQASVNWTISTVKHFVNL